MSKYLLGFGLGFGIILILSGCHRGSSVEVVAPPRSSASICSGAKISIIGTRDIVYVDVTNATPDTEVSYHLKSTNAAVDLKGKMDKRIDEKGRLLSVHPTSDWQNLDYKINITASGCNGKISASVDYSRANYVGTTKSVLTDPGMKDNQLYMITPAEAGSYVLYGPIGETGSRGRWTILQDGIGNNITMPRSTDTLESPLDGVWQIINSIGSGGVRMEAGNKLRLTLDTTDSAHYACGEIDLMAMAVGTLPDVVVEQPGVIELPDQVPIGGMTSLRMKFTQEVVSASQGTRCPGMENVAIMIGAVYFRNEVTDQTIQYQVYTYDTRGFKPHGSWFANLASGAFLGVSDNIVTDYGGSYMVAGGPEQTYDIDILPRVKEMISQAPNSNVDKDLNHWKVIIYQFGPFTNGAATIDSLNSKVDLISTY